MGNRNARKCQQCKKAIGGMVSRKYCSNACRQAAYKKRHAPASSKKNLRNPKVEKPLNLATCVHCNGSFFAKTKRATFCSTSCRTLHHRYMKQAIPSVLGDVWGIPYQTAVDVVETQPIGKLRETLECLGYSYHHAERRWIGVADQL